MDIVCLATDYDGTLAHDGVVDGPTVEALNDFKRSGRKLILVTGRELPDLRRVFPHLELFDTAVVENGALLFTPSTGEESPLDLFTPAGRTMTAPLLKVICNSSPSSRIASRTAVSFGCQVATIERPTDSG